MVFKNKEQQGAKLEKEQKDALSKLEFVIETIDTLKEIRKIMGDSLNDVSFSLNFL